MNYSRLHLKQLVSEIFKSERKKKQHRFSYAVQVLTLEFGFDTWQHIIDTFQRDLSKGHSYFMESKSQKGSWWLERTLPVFPLFDSITVSFCAASPPVPLSLVSLVLSLSL